MVHNLKKRCIKRHFTGIHDRFLRDHVFRKRMLEHHRNEDFCLKWDDLAEQDFTDRMSELENFHYRQYWWISVREHSIKRIDGIIHRPCTTHHYTPTSTARAGALMFHHPTWVEHHTGGSRSTPTVHPC